MASTSRALQDGNYRQKENLGDGAHQRDDDMPIPDGASKGKVLRRPKASERIQEKLDEMRSVRVHQLFIGDAK